MNISKEIYEFANGEASSLSEQLRDRNIAEQKIKEAATNLAYENRSLYARSKNLVALWNSIKNVETSEEKERLRVFAQQASNFIYYYENGLMKSPAEELLKWSYKGDGEQFFLSEAYDVLGKEAARTLRVLLKNALIDHYPRVADL